MEEANKRQTKANELQLAITARNENSENFVEIGQTETISSLNPKFERNVVFVFRLDLEQQIRLILYSVDHKTEVIQRKIGQSNFNLFSILHGVSESLQIPLILDQEIKSTQPSFIQCSVSQPGNCGVNSGTVFQFIGHNMDNSGLIPSPYFLLELVPTNNVEESSPLPILLYRSEFCNKNANPRWKEFLLPSQFFPSSADWSLRISCYNYAYNQIEGDQLIGQAFTTFYQLIGMNSVKFLLRTGHKNKDQNPSIELVRVSNEPVPSLINLIKSGHQFYSTIAIDFTSNNGGPNSSDSLHFIHPHISNAYTHVLEGVSTTFSRIDKLRRIALLGFGAKLPPSFQFSNLFALNGNLDSPWLRSTSDILNCYKNFSLSLLPFAPTQYSQVIHYVIKLAKVAQKAQASIHFSLIILTNGQLRDPSDTIDTIVEASFLPISIFFVSIGNNSHPTGETNLRRLCSPTIKSTKNIPLQRETATKKKAGEGKPTAKVSLVHAAKEGAQHAKDAVSKLAHGSKNGEVIGDDKLKTEIKTVLDGMIKHPEKIKQGNKAKLVKAVTFKKAHEKKAAALPKTNSGHLKKPAIAHPAVPKNAQAKPGHINVKQAHGQHNTNQAAASPISKSGPLKKLAGLKADLHKIPGHLSGKLHTTQHVSGTKSAETPPKHSPINFENLLRNVSSPLARKNVENKLPNSSNPSVPGALPSNMFGGKRKTEMDSEEDDWDVGDVDDFEEFSNRPIGNKGKAESDENGKGASEEDKSDELDVDDFKEDELNSNLLKTDKDKKLLSEGNGDLDEDLKKPSNEEVRKATELLQGAFSGLQKNIESSKVNSALPMNDSLVKQIGNPNLVDPVGA
uniref:C2 domain-containing protein n=1 Tax=Meloidogyne javanica TaxID=6303 RepID=A0A915LL71_MELJA